MEADVRDTVAMTAAVAAVVAGLGRLDAVVANAGVLKRAPLEALLDEDWQRILDIDLTGVMRTVRAAVPVLPAGGSMVLVSSIAGAALGWAGHTPLRVGQGRPDRLPAQRRSSSAPAGSGSTPCCPA